MGRTSEAMAAKIVERYRETPNYKKVADELGLNEKTVKKYVDTNMALASRKKPEVVETERAGKENLFPQTIQMLESGRSMIEIVSEYGLEPEEATKYFEQYARIKNLDFLHQISKEGPSLIDKTAELLRLLQKEGYSPINCVDEVKNLGSLKLAREELQVLNAKVHEARVMLHDMIRKREYASKELSKAMLSLSINRDSLARMEARRQKMEKECVLLETRCRETDLELKRLRSYTRLLEMNKRKIMQRAHGLAATEARAAIANDQELVRKTVVALVKCAIKDPAMLLRLWTSMSIRRDRESIIRSFDPLATAMLNEIRDDITTEVADFAGYKALSFGLNHTNQFQEMSAG